jgi:hypothetical protein
MSGGPNAELVGHIAETATDQGLSGQAEKGTIDQRYHCTDILAEICERVGGMGEESDSNQPPKRDPYCVRIHTGETG